MLCSLQLPFKGQLALFRQLQSFFASVSDFLSCALLCESMVFLMFGRQLYDNLRVLRLKIVLSMWSTGKLLSMIFRNARPTLVFTLRSNGGLYHVIFLDLFLLSLLFPVACGLYSNLCVYPLLASAAWYSGTALLKMSSFDDISESRLYIVFGFKSTRAPPVIEEMKVFGSKMTQMIQNIEFTSYMNDLQKKLMKDVKKTTNTTDLIIKADKTTNFYRMKTTEYQTVTNYSAEVWCSVGQ